MISLYYWQDYLIYKPFAFEKSLLFRKKKQKYRNNFSYTMPAQKILFQNTKIGVSNSKSEGFCHVLQTFAFGSGQIIALIWKIPCRNFPKLIFRGRSPSAHSSPGVAHSSSEKSTSLNRDVMSN